ncbi:MAG: hypothetical protein IT389_12985, partial [Nitrospira sp.]|nr:hypothetical protein [Nitrospira sp.]
MGSLNDLEEVFVDVALLNTELESIEFTPHQVPWKKQYEIWRHGDEMVAASKSRHDLEVAIVQFQRAVEQRDTILENLYCFAAFPGATGKNKQYTVMADLGIIRPSLKEPLRELRNKIVHEVDDVDVDRKRCEILSDS